MDHTLERYTEEQLLVNFQRNLKLLISRSDLNQNIFAERYGIAASTLSAYVKGSKMPTLSFLCKLKSRNPDLNLDDFLFSDVSSLSTEIFLDPHMEKFHGLYYIYYLDNRNSESDDSSVNRLIMANYGREVKTGIIYINSCEPDNCVAIFGLSMDYTVNREENVQALSSKMIAEQCVSKSFQEISALFQEKYPRNCYTGTFSVTDHNLFINLSKNLGTPDHAFIALHNVKHNRNDEYIGGSGTLNSIECEYSQNPTVQMICLSKYLIKDSRLIRPHLIFPHTKIDDDSFSDKDLNNITKVARALYNRRDDNLFSNIKEKTLDNMFIAFIQTIIDNHLANYDHAINSISKRTDSSFYQLLEDLKTLDNNSKQVNL